MLSAAALWWEIAALFVAGVALVLLLGVALGLLLAFYRFAVMDTKSKAKVIHQIILSIPGFVLLVYDLAYAIECSGSYDLRSEQGICSSAAYVYIPTIVVLYFYICRAALFRAKQLHEAARKDLTKVEDLDDEEVEDDPVEDAIIAAHGAAVLLDGVGHNNSAYRHKIINEESKGDGSAKYFHLDYSDDKSWMKFEKKDIASLENNFEDDAEKDSFQNLSKKCWGSKQPTSKASREELERCLAAPHSAQGSFMKLSRTGSWKRRFFQLRGPFLVYYIGTTSEGVKGPNASIDLRLLESAEYVHADKRIVLFLLGLRC